jgi:hypothetical protein
MSTSNTQKTLESVLANRTLISLDVEEASFHVYLTVPNSGTDRIWRVNPMFIESEELMDTLLDSIGGLEYLEPEDVKVELIVATYDSNLPRSLAGGFTAQGLQTWVDVWELSERSVNDGYLAYVGYLLKNGLWTGSLPEVKEWEEAKEMKGDLEDFMKAQMAEIDPNKAIPWRYFDYALYYNDHLSNQYFCIANQWYRMPR